MTACLRSSSAATGPSTSSEDPGGAFEGIRLAVVGDIHGHWSDADTHYFDASDYDAVIVVGDLAGLRWEPTLRVARSIGRCKKPVYAIAGNHDGPNPAQLLAEVAGRSWLGDPFASRQQVRYAALMEAYGDATVGGYSAHEIGSRNDRVTLVMGRPQSMGGPTLSFPAFCTAAFEVDSLEASVERMKSVIDSVRTERILFVAHNGPAGLGNRRSDIWGCDFRAAEGDWGDPDLAEAVAYARSLGKRVLGVVAGHMHHRLKGGGDRIWRAERDDVTYVNAARVPRVDASGRHHVRLQISGSTLSVADVRVLP